MYLPKIMIDRFGWLGFLAFAAPNVIGCVGFGYIIRTRQRSQRFSQRHRAAMIHFSHATIAFHTFFLCYITRFIDLEPVNSHIFGVALPAAVILAALVLVRVPDRIVLAVTAIVWIGGVALLMIYGVEALTEIPVSGSLESTNLIFLAPVLCFGFLLCPYFDLTFHHALQQSPSRHTFAIFGVAFLLMLLLTCAIWFNSERLWPLAMAHIIVQSFVTVLLHVRGLHHARKADSDKWYVGTRPAILEAAAFGIVLAVTLSFVDNTIATSEDFYLRFLVFYGLIFPAYGIMFMLPGALRPSGRNFFIFGSVVLAALPFYELGFIHERMWILAVPLCAVVLWITITVVRRKTHGWDSGGLERVNPNGH